MTPSLSNKKTRASQISGKKADVPRKDASSQERSQDRSGPQERSQDRSGAQERPRDRPWLIRTYSGHSSAAASNDLYRSNLAKGQTGLSVAFDLPTQTGYDSDHPLASGEVGKVGVPVCHLGDMQTLFDAIPIETMNTSMTINATAPWLLALYIALGEERGIERKVLSGTVQNDIIKEYLSRGTYIFPPRESLRMTSDVVTFATREIPKWNPINICSYHLQEAGATPVQEMSFALAGARTVLDTVKERVQPVDFPPIVGRISFFVNAGTKLVTELCKMRAFVELWDEITSGEYGIEEAKYRRFRYGMQVNSLGLTEQQPENNVYRILISMLPVVLSKTSRARAVQLPAWNEALGLPRPWDQQWSLRLQQIMALETDILEYGDIFDGSDIIRKRTEELKEQTRSELKRIDEMGGVIAAVESGYMKSQLVHSNTKRLQNIENGVQKVIGVNCYQETLPSPLLASGDGGILKPDPKAQEAQIGRLMDWRQKRDDGAVRGALAQLSKDVSQGENIMPASIRCAHAGVTTGEWSDVMRKIFGEYRAPTGISMAAVKTSNGDSWEELRRRIGSLSKILGRRAKILIGKPGLDGHSNGAEQIAVRARDAGFEVVYEGIRLTPKRIATTAMEESVHLVGLSILSGSHLDLARDVIERMRDHALEHIPVIVGGIIPVDDIPILRKMGVAAVYTPKDFSMRRIMEDIAGVIERQAQGKKDTGKEESGKEESGKEDPSKEDPSKEDLGKKDSGSAPKKHSSPPNQEKRP